MGDFIFLVIKPGPFLFTLPSYLRFYFSPLDPVWCKTLQGFFRVFKTFPLRLTCQFTFGQLAALVVRTVPCHRVWNAYTVGISAVVVCLNGRVPACGHFQFGPDSSSGHEVVAISRSLMVSGGHGPEKRNHDRGFVDIDSERGEEGVVWRTR